MKNFWYIKGDFLKERSKRIGASDVPALIPDPENPTQSLAGYGRTPITVWMEKTGKKDREPAGLPAEMGHFLENKALELFIREIFDRQIAKEFIKLKTSYEEINSKEVIDNPEDFQLSFLKHNTQIYTENKIAHPDCVFMGGINDKVRAHGLNINLSNPFLIEAKSASLWSAKRPEGSFVKGYDFSLKTWQGVPLKHYMQIQDQLALFEIDLAYLALIYNTSEFHVWEIKANKKHQKSIMEIVNSISECINRDIPPKDFAINQDDIKELYPDLQDDFVLLTGDEKEKAVEIAKLYKQAKDQEKKWSEKKQEALDSMSIIMKDYPEIRDENGPIARWSIRKGYEKILSLKELKEADDKAYNYLKRKKLIFETSGSRTININFKED